jgi:hypothetical protein
MRKFAPIIAVGVITVILFDISASVLSSYLGLSYGYFSIGSFLIYLAFGFLGARVSSWFYGSVVGAILGLADSTIGWAISWSIGPGRPEMEMNGLLIAITVLFVMVYGAVVGLIGGALSLLKKRDV